MDGATIERQLKEFFEARAQAEGIAAAWLFGSVARGVAHARGSVEPDSVLVGILFKDHPGEVNEPGGCAAEMFVASGPHPQPLSQPHTRPPGEGSVPTSCFLPLPSRLLLEAPTSRRNKAEPQDGEDVCAAFTPLSRGSGCAAGRGVGGEGQRPQTLLPQLPAHQQQGELDSALGHAVRVLVLNGCEWLELMFAMLRDNQLLFEGERSLRIEFAVRTRNEFLDFEPYLKLYRSKNPR